MSLEDETAYSVMPSESKASSDILTVISYSVPIER